MHAMLAEVVMRASRRALLVGWVVLALAPSCVDREDELDSDDLRTDVRAMQTELDAHHAAILRAESVGALVPEMDRHEAAMDSMMSRMRRDMNGMRSHCSGSGMMEMHDTMQDMELEIGFHRQRLEAATDMDHAYTACTDYAASMGEMLDGMMLAAGDSCMN